MVSSQVAWPYSTCAGADVVDVVTLGGGAATIGGGSGGGAVVEGANFRVVVVFSGVVTDWALDVTVVAGEWAAAAITVRAPAAVDAVGIVDVVADGSSPPLTCDDAAPAKVVKTPVRPSARLERADNRRPEPPLVLDPAADSAMTTPVDGRWRRANTGTTAKLPQRAKMVTFRRLFDRETLRCSVLPFPRGQGKRAKTNHAGLHPSNTLTAGRGWGKWTMLA
jgi:hypothetical protein